MVIVQNKTTKERGILKINSDDKFEIFISPNHWIPIYSSISEMAKYWEVVNK